MDATGSNSNYYLQKHVHDSLVIHSSHTGFYQASKSGRSHALNRRNAITSSSFQRTVSRNLSNTSAFIHAVLRYTFCEYAIIKIRTIMTKSYPLSDEIIRQVTINCAERGLLLTDIRDELQLTLKSYQELVEQARDFGFRKVQQTKEIEEQLKAEYEKLLQKKNALEAEIMEGKIKMSSTYRKFRDLRQATERTRNLKLAYLQRSNDQFFVSTHHN